MIDDILVVPDGYGLAYSIGEDYVRWTITGVKEESPEGMKSCLAQAAEEVKGMLEAAEKVEGSGEVKTKL
jgi:carnitine O-acetyltransferase